MTWKGCGRKLSWPNLRLSYLCGVIVESNETVPSEQSVLGTVSEFGSFQIQWRAIHSTAMIEWMRRRHQVLEIYVKKRAYSASNRLYG
jgi:hypothetical protein